jgi:hypothetical protein
LLSVTLAFLTVTFGMGSLLGLASIPSEKELIENYIKTIQS